MNKPVESIFTTRPAYVLDLPLKDGVRVLHPERVILKIGSDYKDVGAFCYELRSDKKRKPGQPVEVDLSSFLKQRPKQILQAIKVLSAMLMGNRPATVISAADRLKLLLNWADSNGHADCLAGGEATRKAFRAYAAHVEDRFRRQEIGSANAYKLQKGACELIQAITGLEDLTRGVRIIRAQTLLSTGTEPAPDHDFAHMLALSQSLFDGLCDLVLNNRPFPYKLALPKSLGWEHNHLWLFPAAVWRMPPHQWCAVREMSGRSSWAFDYQNGRLATIDEIRHHYKYESKSAQRGQAAAKIRAAQRSINNANADLRHNYRVKFGVFAHNAFCWLFHANTGGNQQPILDLETDGTVDKAIANQGFREIKFRASGKDVFLPIPVSFLPSLRRFMELRAWLLNGVPFPYLFLTFGSNGRNADPVQVNNKVLDAHNKIMRGIDPKLTPIRARKTRATVNDALLRGYDANVVAKIMGHTEATELKKYGRGSVVDHRDEMTMLFEKISTAARKQTVIPVRADLGKKAKKLEQGGGCAHYGHPEAMTDDSALQPDCGSGCWFCCHRMLVADEEDTRKVASASFVMEQLILGPQHEANLRPLIIKCESDLESIAKTRNCRPMVERIKKDVYEDGNLTPYWAEKYHLFLELEVIV